MRILQAFDFFSLPHGGGTVDILYRLSQTLSRRGHEVVIYTSDFELDQVYIDTLQGVKVHPFHSWFNLSGIHLMTDFIPEARKSISNFDIIHLLSKLSERGNSSLR